MSYLLSLIEFKSWLGAKNETDKVGWQRECQGCPIFKCLSDKGLNMDTYDAFVSGMCTYTNNELLENPNWVREFISKIDSLQLEEKPSKITAKQALEVVNNLHICTVCNKYNPEGKNCGKDNCDW